MSLELDNVNKAVAEFDAVAAGLQALKDRYTGVVFEVGTTKGMQEAKEARAAIREPRYQVENLRKAAKAPILTLGKKLDSRAAEITAEILKIEEPIHAQIAAEEQRKEAERQAKVAAELARVQGIQERITELRGGISRAGSASAALILEYIADLEKIPVDDSFAEFRQQAEDAKAGGLATLRELHQRQVAFEAEQARVKAEREELAELRRKQAEQEAQERARVAAEEAEARRLREAEEARLRAAREAEEAEAARLRKIEEDRLAEQRAELARQQAAFDAQQAEAARQAAPVAPEPPPAVAAPAPAQQRPTADEIITVLSDHFGADRSTVTVWLMDLEF